MAPQTQTGNQFVSNFAAAVQGAATALVDFTTGSIMRAIAQAVQGIALWLQAQALQVTALTRFATSNGADADSWGGDFNFPRLPATFATGPVTLARYTPSAAASITAATQTGVDENDNPIWFGGTIVQTPDGTIQFRVIPDTNQGAYNATTNTYNMAIGTQSCTATVVALVAGTGSNVAEGMITSLAAAVPSVDTVTNAAAFENADDAELDVAYKARFPAYLASLEKGTPKAVKTAVQDVQQGVLYDMVENQTYSGTDQLGTFYVVADDGSGDPGSTFLNNVANAVEATRPIGTSYGVFGPTVVNATIVLTVTAATGYTHAQIAPIVQTAIQNYVNSRGLGVSLSWGRLFQVAFDASAGVADVSAVTLNSGTSDLTATAKQTIKYATVTVN